jgi:hypothetical protein
MDIACTAIQPNGSGLDGTRHDILGPADLAGSQLAGSFQFPLSRLCGWFPTGYGNVRVDGI